MSDKLLEEKMISAYGRVWLAPEQEMLFDRKRTCCFTGHRPEKLPADEQEYDRLVKDTRFYIRALVLRGYNTFITGMSRGFDLIAAELLLNDGQVKDKVKIVCAVPYRNQYDEMRTAHERTLYCDILRASEMVVLLNEKYSDGCYRTRNQFMVNHSSAIVGYLNSTENRRSGSHQTAAMAERAGLESFITYEKNISVKRDDD